MQQFLRKIYYRIRVRMEPSGAKFSPNFYLQQYPDVAAAGIDPYEHYVLHGKAEGRSGFFPKLNIQHQFTKIDPQRETILLISHEASLTGAPILGFNLVQEFLKKYNVIVLFLGAGPIIELCRAEGAETIGPFDLIKRIPRLADSVIEHICQRVAIKYAIVNSIEARYVLQSVAKWDIATISLIHEFASCFGPSNVLRQTIYWSGKTIFSSKLTRDSALQDLPELDSRNFPVLPQGRCFFSLQGLDKKNKCEDAKRILQSIRPANFPDNGFVILGVGTIEFRKGVDLFIQCAALVIKHLPDCPIRFIWIGQYVEAEHSTAYRVYIADQIIRAGLENHVFIINKFTDLSVAYQCADLLLLSSRLDPLPNVAIDALSEGVPVICFAKATGIADILCEHALENSCVADYLDIQDVAQKICALIQSPELLRQVGDKSAQLAANTFNMQKYTVQLDQLAAQVIVQVQQSNKDAQTIENAKVMQPNYFNSSFLLQLDHFFYPISVPPEKSTTQLIREYVRAWYSGVGRRKLFPGFYPAIYLEQHGVSKPGIDPLVDYMQNDQPNGQWQPELILDNASTKPIDPNIRIGLHIHIYYIDLFPDILQRLDKNKIQPDLLISVTNEENKATIKAQLKNYKNPNVDIRIVPNCGRDIGPFLTEFREKILNEYDLIGHIHTKKTVDAGDESIGRMWYQFLLENLLGGKIAIMDTILGKMADDAKIGMVFPDDPNVAGWGKNKKFIIPYSQTLGFDTLPDNFAFPIGTMFWAAVPALKPIFALNFKWEDYPIEPLPYDGSVLHGLERLFGLIVPKTGYKIVCTYINNVTR